MAVLVTGGAGFVGLNIVEALLGRGEAVVVFGLDDPPEAVRRAFGVLPGNLTTMRGDVATPTRSSARWPSTPSSGWFTPLSSPRASSANGPTTATSWM